MGVAKLTCPECKEQVESLSPCPLCGFVRKRATERPPPIEPLAELARWTVRLLLFQALAGLFSFSLTMGELVESPQMSVEQMAGGGMAAQTTNCFLSLVWLATTIFFLIWQYRLRLNYDSLGVRAMAHSPAMNVVWWFVPVANWFMPYMVLQELWRAGAAGAPEEGPRLAWRRTPACPLIRTYWIANLLTIAVSLFGTFAMVLMMMPMRRGGAAEVESFQNIYLAIMLFSNLGNLAARFMEVFIVERLTRRQQTMQERLASSNATEAGSTSPAG